MREIALHLLDIAENSVAAGARNISIQVSEDLAHDRLTASVQDDGKGMDAKTVRLVVDPFVTSRTTRKVGLGIPLLKEAAEACNGSLSIQSTLGKGTRLDVDFQRSHIDRMPLGDLAGTILTLVVAYPQVHWIFGYKSIQMDGSPRKEYEFDDQPIKEELVDIPLCEPDVLAFLRGTLEEGVAEVQESYREKEPI
jgi:anti-sigma regulatory factor (Ser/Thr protein kinase)